METTTIEPTPAPTDDEELPGLAVRLTLASLLAVSGAIHLVMTPDHYQESSIEGILFALLGWAQVALAIVAISTPRRNTLRAIVAVNVLALVGWGWSRVVGLPFGPNPNVAQDINSVDGLTAAFEAGAVLLAGVALARPGLGAKMKESGLVLASIVPVAVLLAGTMVITSPEAANHSHAEVASDATLATATSNRCDLGFNPAAYWRETALAGIDTVGAPAATAPALSADGHAHGGGAAANTPGTTVPKPSRGRGSEELDDMIRSTVTADGEGGAARVVVELTEVSDETYDEWLQNLPMMNAAAAASGVSAGMGASGNGDDTGHGGHIGPHGWTAMTDPADCAALEGELARTRAVTEKYDTVAKAEAAGYTMVAPYVPGIASHWMNYSYVDGTFNIDEPEMILFNGNDQDSRAIGLSYYINYDSELEPTQGFTGDNDHFHRHLALCIAPGGVVIGGSTTTVEDCQALGGTKANGAQGWMNHVWNVPGCESPWGIFAGATPLLDFDVADDDTHDNPCGGSSVLDRYDLSPGTVQNTPSTVSGVTELASGN